MNDASLSANLGFYIVSKASSLEGCKEKPSLLHDCPHHGIVVLKNLHFVAERNRPCSPQIEKNRSRTSRSLCSPGAWITKSSSQALGLLRSLVNNGAIYR